MSEKLISAIRQYRHNDSDEFVAGYDKQIIDKLFKAMQARIEELENGAIYFIREIKPHTPRAAPIWKPMYRQSPPVMARPRYGR